MFSYYPCALYFVEEHGLLLHAGFLWEIHIQVQAGIERY